MLYFTYLVFFGKRLLLIFPCDFCVIIIFFITIQYFLFPIVIACLCFTKQFPLQSGLEHVILCVQVFFSCFLNDLDFGGQCLSHLHTDSLLVNYSVLSCGPLIRVPDMPFNPMFYVQVRSSAAAGSASRNIS